jgi:hypothetical protein
MIKKIYFRQSIWRNIGFFLKTAAWFCQKKWITTVALEKNAIFSPKIGENRSKL